MAAVAVTRTALSAAELRAASRRFGDAKRACSILAIAMILDYEADMQTAEADI